MTEPVGYLQYHRDYESGVLEVEFVESKDEDLDGGLYEYAPVVLAASLADAQAEIARLRGALEKIAEFQFRVFDSDADEIEATQNIVTDALK